MRLTKAKNAAQIDRAIGIAAIAIIIFFIAPEIGRSIVAFMAGLL